MNYPKSVAFLFAYVPKMPTSVEELSRISALRTQSAILFGFARKMGFESPDRMPAVTTYRDAIFTRSAVFERASAQARSCKTALWVADLWQLLRMTSSGNLTRVLEDLDRLDIDVLDCLSEKMWREFAAAERAVLLREAFSRKMVSSISLPSETDRKGQAPDIQNALKGASANRKKAERRAEQLRPVVDEFRAALPPEQVLTPSMLMRHLNDRGVMPERGKAWSLNSCKNLLRRLQIAEK
ncbi:MULTISPECIES: hypothetical protein [unclassified Rhizobium]|uniref:hypothetical protein n=1 Tax=unclassified Rhizobium TaxID=2613769 RepID=UPI001AEADDAE|nr:MULTISPECIES: hypothetical protein [unclassified Rhizobium]MBP2462833.1 hypothetical protein [Rhizobium sp. PvP014]MBP2530227.1 hypothetical protein [Rhizobium sp. PvP099]